MNILEEAEEIRQEAEKIANEKGITVQEAWIYAAQEFDKKYKFKELRNE